MPPLGPLLEKLAREYEGKFLLAKVDTEREPELAAQFGVRSIPAVFGVRDGKAVDGFLGAAARVGDPELARPAFAHAGRAARRRRPRELEATDPKAAEAKYNEALSFDPDLPAAQVGLARIALEQGRLEDAQAQISASSARGFSSPRPRRSRPS